MSSALSTISKFNSLGSTHNRALNAMLSDRNSSIVATRPRPVSLGIVTALDHEFIATCRALEVASSGYKGKGLIYEPMGRFPINIRLYAMRKGDTAINVAVAQTIRMGNNSAAIAATTMLHEFPELEAIMMLGIAGGIPSPLVNGCSDKKLLEQHVQLGDIFVSEEPIIQYDNVKLEYGKSTNRAMPNAICPWLQTAIKRIKHSELENEHLLDRILQSTVKVLGAGWGRPPASSDAPECFSQSPNGVLVSEGLIKQPGKRQPRRRRNQPLIHYGKLGSANCLLKDPIERDKLRREHGIRAIEMEASGLADAAWNFGIGYGVVRGICDYCDPSKGDDWQKYAAAAAAAYGRAIIDQLIAAGVRRQIQHPLALPVAK